MSKLLRVVVLLVVILAGVLVAAESLRGYEAQAAPVVDAFPPCPPTDLDGRAIVASGLTKAGRLYCTYGLPRTAPPCPTYWDSEITRWARLPDGRVKCVYFKPVIGTG